MELKDGSIRQCFLENEEITDYKGNYFYKRNSHILLKITYEGTAHNIFITNKGRIKGYFFDKYEDRYVLRYGRILILKKNRTTLQNDNTIIYKEAASEIIKYE